MTVNDVCVQTLTLGRAACLAQHGAPASVCRLATDVGSIKVDTEGAAEIIALSGDYAWL